jgi:hypothetical protein
VREVKGGVGRGAGECEGAHYVKDHREVAGFDGDRHEVARFDE